MKWLRKFMLAFFRTVLVNNVIVKIVSQITKCYFVKSSGFREIHLFSYH